MLFVTQNVLQSFHPCFFAKFTQTFLAHVFYKVSPMFFYHPSFLTHTFFTQLLSTHTFHPYFSPILSPKFSPVPFSPIFFSTKCFLQNLNLILFHLSLVIGILSHILFFHPCFFIHTFKKVFTCTFSPILFSPIPFYKVFTYTLLQSFYPYFSPIFSIHTFYKVCTHTFFHPSLISHTFYTYFFSPIFFHQYFLQSFHCTKFSLILLTFITHLFSPILYTTFPPILFHLSIFIHTFTTFSPMLFTEFFIHTFFTHLFSRVLFAMFSPILSSKFSPIPFSPILFHPSFSPMHFTTFLPILFHPSLFTYTFSTSFHPYFLQSFRLSFFHPFFSTMYFITAILFTKFSSQISYKVFKV